ncbi:MAG: isochorismate synthase [Methanobacteriota archaeon]|nr:MAG: isochorismate synthase [Euryarchaeota archaeon]
MIQAILKSPIYPKIIYIEEERIQIALGANERKYPRSLLMVNEFIEKLKKKYERPFQIFGVLPFDFSVEGTIWEGLPPSIMVLPQWQFEWDNGKVTIKWAENETEAHMMMDKLLRETVVEIGDSKSEEKLHFQDIPMEEDWKRLVTEAIEDIKANKYQKIVLARAKSSTIPKGKQIDLAKTFLSLHENYPKCLTFLISLDKEHTFFGSTPETLGKKEGEVFQTMALAGTVPVSEGEQQARNLLLGTKKLTDEHKIVVESIVEQLKKVSKQQTISQPEILRLKNVFHLHTPIRSILKSDIPWYELIKVLHPTPAVGGRPRDIAISKIRSMEKWSRGWYTGLLGWVDHQGDFDLRVALRCALINHDIIWVFAGAGIVDGSEPVSEWEETESKFQPVLNSLVLTEVEK